MMSSSESSNFSELIALEKCLRAMNSYDEISLKEIYEVIKVSPEFLQSIKNGEILQEETFPGDNTYLSYLTMFKMSKPFYLANRIRTFLKTQGIIIKVMIPKIFVTLKPSGFVSLTVENPHHRFSEQEQQKAVQYLTNLDHEKVKASITLLAPNEQQGILYPKKYRKYFFSQNEYGEEVWNGQTQTNFSISTRKDLLTLLRLFHRGSPLPSLRYFLSAEYSPKTFNKEKIIAQMEHLNDYYLHEDPEKVMNSSQIAEEVNKQKEKIDQQNLRRKMRAKKNLLNLLRDIQTIDLSSYISAIETETLTNTMREILLGELLKVWKIGRRINSILGL